MHDDLETPHPYVNFRPVYISPIQVPARQGHDGTSYTAHGLDVDVMYILWRTEPDCGWSKWVRCRARAKLTMVRRGTSPHHSSPTAYETEEEGVNAVMVFVQLWGVRTSLNLQRHTVALHSEDNAIVQVRAAGRHTPTRTTGRCPIHGKSLFWTFQGLKGGWITTPY
jgi:hypothetical protein